MSNSGVRYSAPKLGKVGEWGNIGRGSLGTDRGDEGYANVVGKPI